MAKSPKNETTETEVEDAIELEVETSDAEELIAVSENVTETEINDDETDDLLDDLDGLDEVETHVDPEPLGETSADQAAHPIPEKSSGFFPLLLGGVAAGAIGYGIATYFQPQDRSAELIAVSEDQAAQIADLKLQLENLPAPDTSAIEAQVLSVGDSFTEVTAQLSDLQTRLDVVERQPNLDGTLSETALAAYQAELDELRAELDEQQSAVMTAASQAETDLADARAEAERLEQQALAAAESAAARAAINRVATAVETGAPFADALADLDAINAPTVLTDAADAGVATNAQLIADFPAAARAALAIARSEGASDDARGIGGFLRSQFDVRSTTPQEGLGPDAVLSRAEAATKEGRIADALAEVETLPEVARAEITDWTARAQERADVLNAIAILSETYQ